MRSASVSLFFFSEPFSAALCVNRAAKKWPPKALIFLYLVGSKFWVCWVLQSHPVPLSTAGMNGEGACFLIYSLSPGRMKCQGKVCSALFPLVALLLVQEGHCPCWGTAGHALDTDFRTFESWKLEIPDFFTAWELVGDCRSLYISFPRAAETNNNN